MNNLRMNFRRREQALGHTAMSDAFEGAMTDRKQQFNIGQPPQEFVDASTMQSQFENMQAGDGGAPAAAGGMTGMQKAAIGSQIGGRIRDAIWKMQTRAPALNNAQMNFSAPRRQTIAEQFIR